MANPTEKFTGDMEYINSAMTVDELLQYHLGEYEHKFESDGEKYSLYVVDYRTESEKQNKEFPIDFYCMGFGETDPVRPNALSAEIVEHAKSRGSVLIVPRFPTLTKAIRADDEAVLTLKAVEQLQGFEDLSAQDITIIGFSDGGRSAVALAGLVNEIPPKEGVKRTLKCVSPTSIIDLIPEDTSPRGGEFMGNFEKQVIWLTLEETRLRLNDVVENETKRLNAAVQSKMATGEIDIPEQQMRAAVERELNSKKADGSYEYPLLQHDYEQIRPAEKAYEMGMIKDVAVGISKLLTFPEGREIFKKQFKDSAELNIKFLAEVFERASSASAHFEEGMYEEKKFWQIVKSVATMQKPLWEQVKVNETRNPVCDNLQTFDVEANLPVEDLVFPTEAYGRTIRKMYKDGLRMSFKIEHHIDPVLEEQLEFALKEKDDEMLGNLLIRNSDKLGIMLFPNAKSVSVKFLGHRGHLSGSHLAPLKVPGGYI